MTDWGVEDPIADVDVREMQIDMTDWFWVEHTDPLSEAVEGVLEFHEGKAAYAPELMFDEAVVDWFEEDDATVAQIAGPPLWILLTCWQLNGFIVRPMNGARPEYEEWLASL